MYIKVQLSRQKAYDSMCHIIYMIIPLRLSSLQSSHCLKVVKRLVILFLTMQHQNGSCDLSELSLPIFIFNPESFWWCQCCVRYSIPLPSYPGISVPAGTSSETTRRFKNKFSKLTTQHRKALLHELCLCGKVEIAMAFQTACATQK